MAARGAQGPAGVAGRRPHDGGHRRSAGPHRAVGTAVPGMGRGPRPAAPRRHPHLDRRPSPRRDRRPGQALSPPGWRDPTCWCSGRCCTTSARGAGEITASSAPSWLIQVGTRLGLWPADIDTALGDRALPPAAARHRHPPRPAGSPDHRRRDHRTQRGSGAAGTAHALAEADSLATGPGVWGDWKASLIGDLVRRCRLVMAGESLPQAEPIDAALSFAGGRPRSARRDDAGRECAQLQRHDDRAGQARAVVQGRRRAGAELAAGPFRGDQQCRGRRRSTLRGVAALRLAAGRRAAAPAVHPGARG